MSAIDDDNLRYRLATKLADSLERKIPELTPRLVHGRTHLPGKATAVIGMRRAGKTTFLHQLRRERLVTGIPRERLPYLNLEDETLVGLDAARLHLALEEYYRRLPELRGNTAVTWCFDEIQVVPGWERFVRRMMDEEVVEIFVSGSSAALLSREIATAMRGRAWEVVIHPFSFNEVLRHRGMPQFDRAGLVSAAERSTIERAFLDYLTIGGFPEAQDLDEASRRRLLQDYVDVAMLRDVVERHAVSNIVALRWLVRQLLGNAASAFSVSKFHDALRSQGVAIAKDTVHALLAHLEDCFLVRTVWMESTSERQRMVNPRKAYPIDTGLIPVFDRSGRANTGHALESAVLLELERRRASVTYVRTASGREVDFLARHEDGREELIQACADASSTETAQRELSALQEAMVAHPRATARLLVLTQDALPRNVPSGVEAMPAYEWLLGG